MSTTHTHILAALRSALGDILDERCGMFAPDSRGPIAGLMSISIEPSGADFAVGLYSSPDLYGDDSDWLARPIAAARILSGMSPQQTAAALARIISATRSEWARLHDLAEAVAHAA